MRRAVTVILVALLGLIHAELWFGDSGLPRVRELTALVVNQQASNDEARQRNDRLQAELKDVTQGLEIIEEKARSELGMVKPDEILVQYPQQNTRTN